MPLTLDQYVCDYLPGRGLPWPAPPPADPPRVKPYVTRLPVRAVLWNVYGTLVAVPHGELRFEHDDPFVMSAAMDKLVKEFKMWPAMTRKPGPPGDQMRELYNRSLTAARLASSGGERFPEILSDKVWDDVVRKLDHKDYKFDAVFYGSRDEFVCKLAYFFHASIQGAGAYPGAAAAVRAVADAGKLQGLLADGQAFTPSQLAAALRAQDPGLDLGACLPADLRVLSARHRARKPSPALLAAAAAALAARRLAPDEVLHVGSSLARDVGPAKKAGFRTALFAGDRGSLDASADRLRDPALRPDVLLTELPQVAAVVG